MISTLIAPMAGRPSWYRLHYSRFYSRRRGVSAQKRHHTGFTGDEGQEESGV